LKLLHLSERSWQRAFPGVCLIAWTTLAPPFSSAQTPPAVSRAQTPRTFAHTVDTDLAEVRKPVSPAEVRSGLVHGPASDIFPQSGLWATGKRSIPLAFGLSAVVPGLGQVYNHHWTKAAVAVVIEAAVITTWATWHAQGLDGEDAFRATAHAGWSPAKYASWLNDFSEYLVETYGADVTAPPVDVITSIDYQHPEAWTASDHLAVNYMISQIHEVERQMYHPETGATFSHVLPGFGEQQYYELIGKYFQFAPGWNDYPNWVDENGAFNEAIDPERSGAGGTKPNVSKSFYDYAEDHAHAEDLLRRATHVSLLLIVNHLVAAVDAAVSAKLHNDRLSTTMGFSVAPGGETVAVGILRYRL